MFPFTSGIEKNVAAKFPPVLHPFIRETFNSGKYLTRKIPNFILNQIEMKRMRSVLISYPYHLVIDPTNICMLRCPLCPTWQDLEARPKGKMDLNTFKKLLDEAGTYLFVLNLCNWGEPLLNPELPAMIEYAKKFNIVVGLSTNLNHLPEKKAEELIESGIDIIVISVDGATQESYSKYRVGGDFGKVMENIKKLVFYRKSGKPLLIWQFLVNRYNESEIDSAKAMALEMGIEFSASPMRTSMGKELLLPLHERVSEIQDWLPQNSTYNKYLYEITPESKTRQTSCKWLWNSAVINWDGSVSPCCGVFEKNWDFGICYDSSENKKASLHIVWNGPRYKLARKLIAAFMKKSEKFSAILKEAEEEKIICSYCTKYGFLED